MIIDDSEAEHFLAEDEIHNYNDAIEVISAYDGQEALKTLNSMDDQPCVILIDINMPGMNGFEFLEQYSQKDNKSEIVIMMSSSVLPQDMNTLTNYDFVTSYCVKPFKMENILKHISSC